MRASPMRRPSSAQAPDARSAKSAQGEGGGGEEVVGVIELGFDFSLLASSTSTFPFVEDLEASSSAARCTSSAWQDSCVSAKACAAGKEEGEEEVWIVEFGFVGSAHSVRESSSRKPRSSPSPPRFGLNASITLLRDPGGAPGASVARRRRAARRGRAVGAKAATARGRGRRERGERSELESPPSPWRSRLPSRVATSAAPRGRKPTS